jgi:hypothetical protein
VWQLKNSLELAAADAARQDTEKKMKEKKEKSDKKQAWGGFAVAVSSSIMQS